MNNTEQITEYIAPAGRATNDFSPQEWDIEAAADELDAKGLEFQDLDDEQITDLLSRHAR